MHIVDRRLNPGGKSLENRQRFLRRAKALVHGAAKKSSQDRDIKDVLEGGEVSIPLDGMNEPRFHREGGTRDMVLPGNKKFVEGNRLPRSGGEGRGRPTDPGEGDSEDAFRFVLTATNLSTFPRRSSNCPTSPSASSPRPKARGFTAPATRHQARRRTFRSAARCGWRWRGGSRCGGRGRRPSLNSRRNSPTATRRAAPS